jgi:hypothetical protein
VKRFSPLTVAPRLVCAALVAVPMLLEGSAGAGRPPPQAVATRAVSDGASTIAELRARRLRVPHVQSGQECPKPDVNLRLDGVGPMVSAGAAAVTVFSEDVRLAYKETQERPHPVKVLWLVHADQRQPVIVRGERTDGRGSVQFFNGARWFRTYPLTRDVESIAPPEWRDIPSSVRVRERGCYAFQIDGPDFQSIFVVPAEPRSDAGDTRGLAPRT